MKKLATVFLFVFAVFFFVGCTQVTYFFKITPDGQVIQGVSVRVDRRVIDANAESGDINFANTMQEIKDILNEYKTQYRRILTVEHVFEEGEDKNFLLSIDDDFIDANIWEITLTLRFASIADYLRSVESLKEEQERLDGESNNSFKLPAQNTTERITRTRPFRNYVIYREPTRFASFFIHTQFIDSIKKHFSQANIEYDATFMQIVATTDSRLRTRNSTRQRVDGLYVHTIAMNTEQARTGSIESYFVSPNIVHWALLAIGLTTGFILGYLIYAFYKSPSKRQV